MSQGNDFANYASSADDSAVEGEGTASDDMWFVAIASDDIKQMTVDQLDEAFRLGVITAQTAVWTEGMETWAPLGEVADLDSDSDGDQHSSAAGASALESAVHHSLHQSHAFHQSHDPHQSDVFQTGSRSRGMEQPSFAPGPNSFAPVTASLSPASIFAAPAPGAQLLQSSVPVALNVDEDMPSIARGRRWHPERWLLAVAAIAGVGVTAYNNSDLFSASAASSVEGSSSKALAARPYEAGGVERGATPAAPSHDSDSDEPAPRAAAAKTAASDEPAAVGSTSPSAAKEAEAPAAEAAVGGAGSKDSLKGSFSKAFASGGAKKPPAGKGAKAVKPRKASHAASTRASKTATRATKAAKKPGVPRAASAFDPLNGSLP